MRHPSSRAVFSYWSRLKGRRAAPARAEIDPRDLAPHLGDIFLLDSSEQAHALRLAGSRMEAAMGEPLIGRPYGALFGADSRREALQALAGVTAEGEPMLLGFRIESAGGNDAPPPRPDPAGQWLRPSWVNHRPVPPAGMAERRSPRPGAGELLLLPLEHRGRIGARVLGVFGVFAPAFAAGAGATLTLTGQRMLGDGARSLVGPGLSNGATVVAREGVVQLFRGMGAPLRPENDR